MMQCTFNHTTITIPPKMFIFSFPVCPTVHLVDIWNVIEAFRENGINTMDLNADLSVARLEVVLSTIFYQLNKRMPTTHQINVEQSISLLLNFLLAAYDPWVSHHMAGCGWLCTFTSEVLTWANVLWSVTLKCLPKWSESTFIMSQRACVWVHISRDAKSQAKHFLSQWSQ